MPEDGLTMRKYAVIAIIITLSMIICPFAATGKKKASTQEAISAISVIEAEDGGEYISVMSADSEIRKLEMREYLIGCVAAEMPAEYHPEALKAQAAAVYTYAIRTMKSGSGEADITNDTSRHQGYLDKEQRKEKWGNSSEENEKKISAAVDAVYGNLITYDGEAALTVYHSVSSGATQSASELWGGEYPYLVCVASPGDKLSPDYCETVTFTQSEMESLLGCDGEGVEDVGYTEGGYVSEAVLCGTRLEGAEIREKLSLRSNCFDVSYEKGEYVFEVRGYGHGVGMSQYGADYMARQGFEWQEIISHYYPGTVIVESK